MSLFERRLEKSAKKLSWLSRMERPLRRQGLLGLKNQSRSEKMNEGKRGEH